MTLGTFLMLGTGTGIGLAFAAAGCSQDGGCGTPSVTGATYSCSARGVDAGGCPTLEYPPGTAVTGSYAFGCTATFPACSGFSGSPSAVLCTCESIAEDGAPAPAWVCPN